MMPTNKNLPPICQDGDEIILGRGADAIRIKGKDLKVVDASNHVRGHYPDMYPWDTPHRHPEWDVRRSHACDLCFPPDNIPVAAIPAAIRELKRLAIGGWIVNAPVSEDLLEGAVVRWDATAEMWVAAIAGDLASPSNQPEEKPGCNCGCPIPPLPDSDLPSDVPSKPVTPVQLPCTDFDPKLDKAPSEAFQPAFMGVVISGNGVQTHGVVRHASFNYPARTPLYLSATEPGHVTEKNTGVFVGTVLVPGVLLLNVYAQIFDNYLVLVKDELKSKIECEMKQLISMAEKLMAAMETGDSANAEAVQKLQEFITIRLQTLQSFLDNVNRQYEELLKDLGDYNQRLDDLEEKLGDAEQSGGKGHVVNTISGRDTLKDAPEGTVVFVRDASGDPAVKSGPATYILVGSGADGYWANITSSIKIDGGDILGDIDAAALQNAIEKAHGHANKSLLDSITSLGEKGVKIGDVIIINEDGTLPGGTGGGSGEPTEGSLALTTPIPIPDSDGETTTISQMAGDVDELKDTVWVAHLDALPTADNFAEATAGIPEGGLFTVPHEGDDDNSGGNGSGPSGEEYESLLSRVVQLETNVGKISQTVLVEAPAEDEESELGTQSDGDDETTLIQDTVVASHTAEDGRFGIASDSEYGHVRILDTAPEEAGAGEVLSVAGTRRLIAGVSGSEWPEESLPSFGTMVNDTTCLVTTSGDYQLPAGKYKLVLVGGGGNGGGGSRNSSNLARGGRGGGASVPIEVLISSSSAIPISATIGAGGGVTTVTALGNTYTGNSGDGGGYGNGGTGHGSLSYSDFPAAELTQSTAGSGGTYAGGAGGAGVTFTESSSSSDGIYTYERFEIAGGGGGAGSRLSLYLSSFPTAGSGGNKAVSFAPTKIGYGGNGGQGYGAGGGGGASVSMPGSYAGGSGATGGAGSQGCVLITFMGAAL